MEQVPWTELKDHILGAIEAIIGQESSEATSTGVASVSGSARKS